MRRVILTIMLVVLSAVFHPAKAADLERYVQNYPGFQYIDDTQRRAHNLLSSTAVWIIANPDTTRLFDTRKILGLINNDLFQCYQRDDILRGVDTPLKKKAFQESDLYTPLLNQFLHYRELLMEHPVVFNITDLKHTASHYDLDAGGFYIKIPFLWMYPQRDSYATDPFPWHISKEIAFDIPPQMLRYFVKEKNYERYYLSTFFIKISNEKIAMAIENEKPDDPQFKIICLTHVTNSSGRPAFLLDSIYLYHIPSGQIVWSTVNGDLSPHVVFP